VRLIIGNLDAEIEMSRAATPGPHPSLSAKTARLVARHASHLRVFARPGDELRVEGVGGWGLGVGAREILAWAETDSIAALRALPVARCPLPVPRLLFSEWTERLWQLHPDPAIARTCNDRRFAFALAERENWSLPGARIITTLDGLPAHGTWVAKAIFSAAGRERVRFASPPTPPEFDRIERLLSRFGALLLEPWVDRLLDLGCAGLTDGTRVDVFPPHRLDSDAAGVFRAAVIDDSGDAIAEPSVLARVRDTAHAAGEALAAAGYRGPFSVDAYLWRDRAGAVQLQRMSEVNARLTFGLVARAAAERERPSGGGRFELRL
jgi:hypothetical protein